ncbi:MAG: siroheme synthase CysG [Pseudomonadota bacterium]
MNTMPIFATLKNRPVLVVGGGHVALRKIRLLSNAGARITVVAPELCEEVRELVTQGSLIHRSSRFCTADLEGYFLVIAATNVPSVNRDVYEAAEARTILCNSVDDPEHSSFITPAIVDRSPIMIAISSGGAAPVLARMLRERLERWLPPALGRLAQLAKHWRHQVKVTLGSLSERRRFWEALFESPVIDALAAGNDVLAEERTARLLADTASAATRRPVGEAWLVGAGPGDPALLTIRAQQLLQRADVVLHDRLVSPAILEMARRDADFIDVGKPIPGRGCANAVQDNINAMLVDLVQQGLRVCRLKGGDPFVFGRGGEEIEALVAANLPYQVVPGITAAAACAAYAGIPLTHRDHSQSVVLVTAHGKHSVDTLDWASLARDRQTLAFYMGVRRYDDVAQALMANGRAADTPIAVIERGTTPQQRVTTSALAELPGLVERMSIEAPAILIIGGVAAFAKTQGWYGGEALAENPSLPFAVGF